MLGNSDVNSIQLMFNEIQWIDAQFQCSSIELMIEIDADKMMGLL